MDDVEHVLRAQTVMRHRRTVQFNVQVRLALHARRRHADGAGNFPHDALDLESLLLKGVQIVAENLDAHLGADAGADHQNPVLDRLQETGNVTGHVGKFSHQFGHNFVFGQTRSPLGFGFEHDGGFNHLHRRGVGGGLGPAQLAGDGFDFGRLFDDLVLPGHDAFDFRERHVRQQHRHEQQAAFVQRRHEFAAHAVRQLRCQLRVAG